MNASIDQWIRHERSRRRINAFYIFVAAVGGVFAVKGNYAVFAAAPAILLCAGFSNVCMLLGRPQIEATDEEIRSAAKAGPAWFARIVAKLDDTDQAADSSLEIAPSSSDNA